MPESLLFSGVNQWRVMCKKGPYLSDFEMFVGGAPTGLSGSLQSWQVHGAWDTVHCVCL